MQRALKKGGLEFCFIGGLALQRWGEVRHTDDIDLAVWCPLGQERRVVEVLGRTITSLEEDAWGMAKVARMYLGRSEAGQGVDASLAFLPNERRMLDRAVDVDVGLEMPLHCCSAEDDYPQDRRRPWAGLGGSQAHHPAKWTRDGLGTGLARTGATTRNDRATGVHGSAARNRRDRAVAVQPVDVQNIVPSRWKLPSQRTKSIAPLTTNRSRCGDRLSR